MICPDGVTLNSKHRHDYVTHVYNNKYYALDGGVGNGYYRSAGTEHGGIIKEYTINDSIEELREVFHWGVNLTKDKELLPETKWTLLKDLEDEHLDALFDYSKLDWQKILWLKEKLFRVEQEYDYE